jgi:fucose permease
MRNAQQVHRSATRVLSLAMIAIGVALIAQAAGSGGSVLRVFLGALFVAAGVGRLYLLRLRARAREDGRG